MREPDTGKGFANRSLIVIIGLLAVLCAYTTHQRSQAYRAMDAKDFKKQMGNAVDSLRSAAAVAQMTTEAKAKDHLPAAYVRTALAQDHESVAQQMAEMAEWNVARADAHLARQGIAGGQGLLAVIENLQHPGPDDRAALADLGRVEKDLDALDDAVQRLS